MELEKKFKLANIILIEIDSIKLCENFTNSIAMIELITSDAKKLAELILEEEEEERKAS